MALKLHGKGRTSLEVTPEDLEAAARSEKEPVSVVTLGRHKYAVCQGEFFWLRRGGWVFRPTEKVKRKAVYLFASELEAKSMATTIQRHVDYLEQEKEKALATMKAHEHAPVQNALSPIVTAETLEINVKEKEHNRLVGADDAPAIASDSESLRLNDAGGDTRSTQETPERKTMDA